MLERNLTSCFDMIQTMLNQILAFKEGISLHTTQSKLSYSISDAAAPTKVIMALIQIHAFASEAILILKYASPLNGAVISVTKIIC